MTQTALTKSEPKMRVRPSNPALAVKTQTTPLGASLKDDKSDDTATSVLKSYMHTLAEPDAFAGAYAREAAVNTKEPIAPPYNLNALTRLPDENFMLTQCIAAMVTNVYGHGWRLEYVGEDGEDDSETAKKQKQIAEEFLSDPNGETSLIDTLEALGTDRETIGNGYIEVGRNLKGEVLSLDHRVGTTIRLTARDKDETEIQVPILRGGAIIYKKAFKRFRRFIQQVGTKKVYFKEVGDPRKIDPATGEVNDSLPFEETATELFHFHSYNPRSPYGVPRWFSQLPAVLGSRQAELTNFDFFNENAIPAVAVTVSGGQLTTESVQQIEELTTRVRGRKSMNRFMILEVQGDITSASLDGQIPAPRVEFKTFADRQKDGLFLDYKKDCGVSIRSSFRLPPLFVGLSDEMTHATAKTSFEVGESQVFAPERNKFMEFMNRIVLPSMGVTMWHYRALPAKITDSEDVINALETLNSLGGMTPNAAIDFANEYFGLNIAKIDDEWGDWPFEIVKQLASQLKGIDQLIDKADLIDDAAMGTEFNDTNADGGFEDKGVNPGAKEPKTPGAAKAKGKKPAKKPASGADDTAAKADHIIKLARALNNISTGE